MVNRAPTWWRAAHAEGRLRLPAGPPRWCTRSSSTRSPSPEPTWCLRSPVEGRRWCSHTKTAAARRRTARGAGCDSARVQPHTAGKRRSQQPSTSSVPRSQPARSLPAAVPVSLHRRPAGVYGMAAVWLIKLPRKTRRSKHLDSHSPGWCSAPLRFHLHVL